MISEKELLHLIEDAEEIKHFKELNWRGTFNDYLGIFMKNPKVARSAYQRLYDMVVSHGTEDYKEHKKTIVKYKFFEDPYDNGRDGIFGLDLHLMKLVNVFKAAARHYGPEKRVLLLHGPVGSSKSTIIRLLKKGFEQYSRTPEGALFTFAWVKKANGSVKQLDAVFGNSDVIS